MASPSARSAAVAALLLGQVACADPTEPAPCPAPALLSVTVEANPENVLSAILTVGATGADSVGVRFGLSALALDSSAPAVPGTRDSATVVLPVLGLLPGTRYTLQPVLFGGCETVAGATVELTTGALPSDLPRYTAGGTAPSPGYVAFGAAMFGLVIDNTGRVVWYRRFPNGPGLNFQPQPTDHYVARPPPPLPGVMPEWVEVDPLGRITRTLGCARGLVPRFHDLMVETDGSYWIMCDETRIMDLTPLGGVAQARVLGTVVQHLSAQRALLFEWSPFDHLDLADLPPADRAGADVNWTHGNALDRDTDGNLLVSFRSLSQVVKIDTRTGEVLWRMGGARNEFSFRNLVDAGTEQTPFAAQHGLRATGPGAFMLLDNLGTPGASRAERYAYDVLSRSATLVAAYGLASGVVAQLGGTTQDLPDGHVLVSYGNGGRVEEYDPTGNVVWRIDGPAGYVFRAQRIRSLYRPGMESRR